jgi:transposase
MRKQINGLALIVQEVFDLDPFQPALFAFCNRQRDKVKVLYWHKNGFCLLYKRLEKGRFQWPSQASDTLLSSERELKWLLEGLSLESLSTHTHLYCNAV